MNMNPAHITKTTEALRALLIVEIDKLPNVLQVESVQPDPDLWGSVQIFNDLGMDSLDIVELTLKLEEALEIDIDDNVFTYLVNLDDIVKHLQTLI